MECQLPLEEGRVPAGPEPDADAATDTSRPLARWQIKVSRFRFLLRPNVSAHPLLIRHMTLDRQHIWRCTDSRQPDVTVCSVTKSGPPAGVQRRPQLQQRQDPDAVRWSLSDLQPGHRGHVQAEGETSSIAPTSGFVTTAATACFAPNVIFMSTRFRPVAAFCRVPLPATCMYMYHACGLRSIFFVQEGAKLHSFIKLSC